MARPSVAAIGLPLVCLGAIMQLPRTGGRGFARSVALASLPGGEQPAQRVEAGRGGGAGGGPGGPGAGPFVMAAGARAAPGAPRPGGGGGGGGGAGRNGPA